MSLAYQTLRLSYGPAIYLRLDMVGLAHNGDAIPDISGNNLDATLAFSDTVPARIEPYGQASPIETDPDSRAVRIYNAGELVGNHGASISRASDSLIEPAGDLWLDGWFKPETLAATLVSKNKVFDGNCFAIAIDTNGRFTGMVRDSAGTAWTVTAPGFGGGQEELLQGAFYYVALIRTGNVLKIFVNGLLQAQITITSGLPTLAEAGPFVLGAGLSGPWVAQYDEVALNTNAVTDDDVLAVYEAAFNTLPLIGRADLRMIATLNGDQEPTPQLFPFSHNWETPVRETLAWSTDVLPAETDYEQRAAIRQRPLRSLELDAFTGDNRLRRRFHAYLFQNQRRKIYLGDWTEAALLTANANSGSTSLAFVSAGRGFEDGGLLAIYQDEDHFEIVEIDTVGPTSTTLVGATANDWSKGTACAVPVVRAVVADQLNFDRLTDALEETTINFRVLAEDVPLAPRRNGTYTPRYTYKGIEVFDPFILGTNNWNETGRGEVTLRTVDPESPAGVFQRSPNDTASREIVSYSLFLDSRAAISQFLAWAFAIQGRRVPLWVPTLQEDFAPLGATAGPGPPDITAAGHDYTDFYQTHVARRDLALVYNDETMAFRRIVSAEPDGDNDLLEINSAATLTNLRALSFLKLSRLQEDTIGLVWHTDELVEVTLNFLELLTTPD